MNSTVGGIIKTELIGSANYTHFSYAIRNWFTQHANDIVIDVKYSTCWNDTVRRVEHSAMILYVKQEEYL